jgi:serine/threonine-protein kinase RsbW
VSVERFTERELRVSADFAHMPDVRDFAEAAAAEAGFTEDQRYAIKMAFGEAVANAIEHGSAEGDSIDLRATVEDDAFVLYVRDYGTFVPRVDPRGDLPERGRGLAFMSEMMDEVHLHPARDGTRVRLAKRLPTGAG